MIKCSYCQRPIKEGYYRTRKGMIYCYDCYIRLKERAANEDTQKRQQHRMHGDAWMMAERRIDMLEKQIKDEGFFAYQQSDRRWATRADAPARIQQIVSEMNKLELERKMHYDAGMSLFKNPNDNADLMTAIYHEL